MKLPCRRRLVPFLFLAAFLFGVSEGLSQGKRDGSAPLASIRAKLESGAGPVKIVCFGDSVTGLYYHSGGVRTYTDMLGIALRRIYPEGKVTMINAGISGHTTVRGLERLERDVFVHEPDIVTVMYGLNDMTRVPIETYAENLGVIVDRCRAAGAEALLVTPNAVITTASRPEEKLRKYCEAVRTVAREKGAPLCDSFAAFEAMREADPDGWRLTLSDEIHPNMAGHKRIAEQLARTITGKSTDLNDVGPPSPAIGKTLARMKKGEPLEVLAMPPYDSLIGEALGERWPDAKLDLISWPTENLSASELRKDASHRVRKLKPNLVVVAVPRSATSPDREAFIRDQIWIVNYSLSFGKQEWDVVVIHPSVADPEPGNEENDALIRILTAAHDLTLIDRKPGDRRSAREILSAWLAGQ